MKAELWNQVVMALNGREVTKTYLGVDKEPCLRTADGLSMSIGGGEKDGISARMESRDGRSLGCDGELSWLARLLNAEQLESISLVSEAEHDKMIFIQTRQGSLITLWFRRIGEKEEIVAMYDSRNGADGGPKD